MLDLSQEFVIESAFDNIYVVGKVFCFRFIQFCIQAAMIYTF